MKYYAGIDLGGTFVKCGIVDAEGKLLIKDKIPTGRERSFAEIARDMAAFTRSLAEKAGVSVAAAGIGSPGIVDSAHGAIIYSCNLNWRNVLLADEVKRSLGVPVYVTNDANAAALGEQFCGAGKGYSDIVFVTLGTGVGGGIVMEGKLFEGHKSAGAEIGHIVIRMKGERCGCGRRGCFEAYASATALIRQTKRAMQKHPESKLWELCGGDIEKVDGKTSFDGMRAGDRTAKRVVSNYIEYLSEGVTNLCNEFRPEAILLGGGISAEGDYLIQPLIKHVNRKIYGGAEYAPVSIVKASLGNDAGMFGAARFAMLK
ncbi:MAG: ROK family glucokinase [Clostridia bacterium]|nr:ROK family glucokinase [Clostridia bacterium]